MDDCCIVFCGAICTAISQSCFWTYGLAANTCCEGKCCNNSCCESLTRCWTCGFDEKEGYVPDSNRIPANGSTNTTQQQQQQQQQMDGSVNRPDDSEVVTDPPPKYEPMYMSYPTETHQHSNVSNDASNNNSQEPPPPPPP